MTLKIWSFIIHDRTLIKIKYIAVELAKDLKCTVFDGDSDSLCPRVPYAEYKFHFITVDSENRMSFFLKQEVPVVIDSGKLVRPRGLQSFDFPLLPHVSPSKILMYFKCLYS